jgi:hypothetical protein
MHYSTRTLPDAFPCEVHLFAAAVKMIVVVGQVRRYFARMLTEYCVRSSARACSDISMIEHGTGHCRARCMVGKVHGGQGAWRAR